MGRIKVRLDSDGMADLLKSAAVADVIASTAYEVADAAESHSAMRRHGFPVDVRHGTSDRARSIVTITHPAGLAMQAKHGVLTKAVSQTGMSASKVRSR